METNARDRIPTITSTPLTTAVAGRTYAYDLKAFDADRDTVTWALALAPAGMSIDPDQGTLRWTPALEQLGQRVVTVLAMDGKPGGISDQTFFITVRATNSPPLITSTPPTRAAVGGLYTYGLAGRDPDGDPLQFTLDEAPAGAVIDPTTGLLRWTPAGSQIGEQSFTARVTDAYGMSSQQVFHVVVQEVPLGSAPLVTSLPVFGAVAGQPYQYAVVATDPDGDTLGYSLTVAPAGMTIEAQTGVISWTPGSDQLGEHSVQVRAEDFITGYARQWYQVTVFPTNESPRITSAPTTNAAAGGTYRYDVRAVDPESGPLRFELVQGPSGMTIDEFGRVHWFPVPLTGSEPVTVAVRDAFGATTTQAFSIVIGPDAQGPRIDIAFSSNPTAVNDESVMTVTITDDIAVVSDVVLIDNLPVALDPNGQTRLRYADVGPRTIVVRATDTSGNTTEVTRTLSVFDPLDPAGPLVTVTSPTDDQILTAPSPIVATINDTDLLSYVLEYGPADGGPFTMLAQGTDPVIDGQIGVFDPSLLPNSSYLIRLTATDAAAHTSVAEALVHVAGDLKLGNFALSFTDLTVPVAGIPITVSRTYDSLNAATRGELGYGWRLEIRETNLRTSVLSSGLEDVGIYSPYYTGARVYISVPGAGRQGFTFQPRPAPGLKGSFLGIWEPAFVADPGVTSTLTVAPADLLRAGTGEFLDYASAFPYNPASPDFGGQFILTTKEGLKFEIDGTTGDTQRIIDRNGNTLSFTDEGIFSSTGKSVQFDRDPQGRIIAVIDPNGGRVQYRYDAKGDLISVTDRDGNATTMIYGEPSRAHYLTEVRDPLRRTGVRTEYDDQGRMVRMIDANGQAIELTHDLAGSTEVVRDQLGNPTAYTYDARGNVLREVNAEGDITNRTYDTAGNTLTETVIIGEDDSLTTDPNDPRDRTTAFSYDGRGNQLTETDALGRVTLFTYDAFGNVLSTTDALGNTTSNQYDGNGNLTSMTDAAGSVTGFTYDSRGNPLTMYLPGAGSTTFAYDAAGNVTQQTDALGHSTTFTYDANGNQLTETRLQSLPGGGTRTLETRREYDSDGKVRFVRVYQDNVLQSQTETRYDDVGNRVEEIDALGRSTKFIYDDRGLLTTTLLPDLTPTNDSDNPQTQVEYDAAGQEVARIDEMGRRTELRYDNVGRIVMTILADDTPADPDDNPRTQTVYDDAGQVVAEVDARGNRTEFQYDAAGRRTMVILADDTPADSSDNPRVQTAYDEIGRAISQTDPLGHVTQSRYDDAGRPVQTIYPDGTSTRTIFDSSGRAAGRVDQAGNQTDYEYDTLGRLTAVVLPAVVNPANSVSVRPRTEYEYDETGKLVVQRDALGRETRFEYDGQGRRTATILPLGQRSTTEYDASGNVIRTTDFNGDAIRFEYDARNQLTAKLFPDGTSVTFTYTLTGRPETATDTRGTTRYEYDALDRLLERTDPDGVQIQYTYDAAGNRTSLTIPSGTTSYTFDTLNRLDTVTDPAGGLTDYDYNLAGQLVETTLPNGTSETREYDAVGHLTYLENRAPSGVINSYRYELEPAGNRTAVTEHDGRRVEYDYDHLFRLIGEDIFDPGSASPTRSMDYLYDLVSNRLSRNDSAEGTTSYTYDDNDRLLTETLTGDTTRYEYDANGNTLRKVNAATDAAITAYLWDFENRLVAADADGTGSFEVQNRYDSEGIRVSQTVNGDETRFLVDKVQPYAQVVEEYTPGGIIKVSYVHGNDLISQNRAGAKSFYHVDGLASTRALSDMTGEVTDRYIYDAFGRTIGQFGYTGNVYLFAGEARDATTGLDYLRARWMNPTSGQFLSRDSFEGLLRGPATLHKYVYAGANAVNRIDPSGQFSVSGLMAAVTVQDIVSEIALTHVLFAGLTIAVELKVWKPAFAARYAAVDVIGSTDNGMILDAAINQYNNAGALIAAGSRLIEINKSITELGQSVQTLGTLTIRLTEQAFERSPSTAISAAANIRLLALELETLQSGYRDLKKTLNGQSDIDATSSTDAIEHSTVIVRKLILDMLTHVRI